MIGTPVNLLRMLIGIVLLLYPTNQISLINSRNNNANMMPSITQFASDEHDSKRDNRCDLGNGQPKAFQTIHMMPLSYNTVISEMSMSNDEEELRLGDVYQDQRENIENNQQEREDANTNSNVGSEPTVPTPIPEPTNGPATSTAIPTPEPTKNPETGTSGPSENEEEQVKEIDLGEYSSRMEVGGKQLLVVTIIPQQETNKDLVFESSNPSVATINGLGRITAISEGKSIIKVSVDNVSASFELSVERDLDCVPIQDIEVYFVKERLQVSDSYTIGLNLLPANTTESEVTYFSSDTSVATVSSKGLVTAISKGQATITIQAGEIQKQIQTTVVVPTNSIVVNESFVVLKIEETFQIKAQASPEGADQSITFKSADANIATVSADGLIEGKAVGSTTVLVSNGELTKAITVIVNLAHDIQDTEQDEGGEESGETNQTYYGLLALIHNSNEKVVTASINECPILTKDILVLLLKEEKTLELQGDEILLRVDGGRIKNVNNELATNLNATFGPDGCTFEVNLGHPLPGEIELQIRGSQNKSGFLYFYDEKKDKYVLYESDASESSLTIDVPGKYKLTNKEIVSRAVIWPAVLVGSLLTIVLLGYLFWKKRYLFW